jgi:hypothetical protein
VLAELERAEPPTIRLSFAGTGTIVDEVIASMPDTARLVPATEG